MDAHTRRYVGQECLRVTVSCACSGLFKAKSGQQDICEMLIRQRTFFLVRSTIPGDASRLFVAVCSCPIQYAFKRTYTLTLFNKNIVKTDNNDNIP